MKALLRNVSLGLTTLLCSLFILSSGSMVLAANPSYSGVDCSGAAAASPVCHASSTDPLTGSNGIIVKATNLVALVAGIAAVIVIIMAGISFITSGGDSSKVSDARRTINYALIGLVVIVLAKTIITYVVSKV